MSNYPATKTGGYLGASTRGSLSHLGCRTRAKQQLHLLIWQTAGPREQSLEGPYHRVQLRRSAGLPQRPLPGWLERTGTLPPQQLSRPALGPVALSEEPLRFSPPTPAPSRAAAAAFPRLDLNYPPLPTAAALPSPTPSALRPPEERHRPGGAGAGRRQDGSLRRALPKGRASSSRTRGERHQRGLPVSSHFILQSRGPRRTQPTIKSAPAPFLLPPCFSSGAWRGG